MSGEQVPVPLLEQDQVRVKGSHLSAEILELDIPHPTNERDKGLYVRVLDEDKHNRLVTRENIAGILCPSCYPGMENFLEATRGAVTTSYRSTELRTYRHCKACNYIKRVP